MSTFAKILPGQVFRFPGQNAPVFVKIGPRKYAELEDRDDRPVAKLAPAKVVTSTSTPVEPSSVLTVHELADCLKRVDEGAKGPKFRLVHVPLNQGGYTSRGRYFGGGAPLYEVTDADSGDYVRLGYWGEGFLRAADREAAKKIVKKQYPNARF